jgi:hypothetical protein
MKQVYKDIANRTKEVVSIKHIDLDKGQMNFERPPVVFPAALISLSASTQNINNSLQACKGRITVKLCFDFTGNTSTDTPQANLDQSLSFFDVQEEVWNKLQGWATDNFNPLYRIAQVDTPRRDGYKVLEMIFETEWHETTQQG